MNPPPIPSFELNNCPHCGLPLREAVEFCPACGARIEKTTRAPLWLRLVIAIALALFIVPLGLAGACFLMLTPAGGLGAFGGGGNIWGSIGTGAIGLVLIGAAILGGIAIFKLGR